MSQQAPSWRRADRQALKARSGNASATASIALSAVTGLSRHSAWNTSETTHGTLLNQLSSLVPARALTWPYALQQALTAVVVLPRDRRMFL
ncbi:MAG: hypothetical protein ACLS3M_01665 [Collinsella sp.]